jgi:hypothetical protein
MASEVVSVDGTVMISSEILQLNVGILQLNVEEVMEFTSNTKGACFLVASSLRYST